MRVAGDVCLQVLQQILINIDFDVVLNVFFSESHNLDVLGDAIHTLAHNDLTGWGLLVTTIVAFGNT